MSAAEVAREAAQIITERGLAKGIGEDDQGRVCFHGAIIDAQYALHSHGHTWTIADAAAIRVGIRPVRYSDDPSTTVEDVAKLLLQVADDLDAAS